MNNKIRRNISSEKIDKEQVKKYIWKLLKYAKPYRLGFIIAIILSTIGTIFSIIGPDKLSEMTDIIVNGLMTNIDMKAVEKIALFLGILYISSFAFNYIQGFIMATITQKLSRKLRSEISEKINKLPLKYFDKNSTGDILSRVTNDVDTIGQTMNQSVGTLLGGSIMLIGSLFMMFITNIPMTIAAIISTLIGFALMGIILSKSQKYFLQQQTELGNINGHIEEIYSAHNVVKAYNGEKEATEKFLEINNRLFNSAWKSQFISGLMQPIMMFVGNFGYVIVCIVGAVLVMNGNITFGVIVAFMIYIRLFTNPLAQLAQAATTLQLTAAASKRVFDFLEEEELSDESNKVKSLTNVMGNIDFENIKFGYNKDKLVINDFTINVKAGQKVAIVGPTGSGKTTIVNLLMRFYELKSGKILIDGVSISDITRENLHDLFCMVLQDTWLFEGTIKDNIIYNKKDVTDEDVINACKTVGIDHFIRTLSNGYDTILETTENLSVGQKQLFTIARGLIKNAPFLILDEATSSVDTRTEVLIQKAMDKLMKGRTSFIIAHRLSTIKNADIIIVMKDGKIIETGNHNELIVKNGFYANLYNSQFEKEEY